MRLLVDCRYVRIGRHDGISRFTAGLVGALSKINCTPAGAPLEVELLISDRRQLDQLPTGLRWHLANDPTSPLEPLVGLRVRRIRPDVMFSPMQTVGSIGRDYRLLLTLHDLIYYRQRTPPPEFAAPIRLLWRLFHLAWWPQRLLLNRADRVITVSHTTERSIQRHRLTRRPVTVVSNAADPAPDGGRLPATRSLVYMGSFMPYKGVEVLVRAAEMLPGHTLHLMSKISSEQRERLTALAPHARLVFHNGADDDTYRRVLRGATALVSASRDEGFGIPLVEAMSVGTPVVVTDIPVFREVAGAAGQYVPIGDAAGFARAIRELDDPGEWETRSAAARRQAVTFSWEGSARALLEAVDAVAGTPSLPDNVTPLRAVS
ncbi:glycosyltransferase family 4 protein [Microlunatus soli]|uniref:Glycosyltransferase involved in cell wall bisynthesis n=1 Tax=Microlunatus soli TaxID=630515 RepID=A0A1H1YH27_9ACTN|nr:glycosyltransferase family 1 protein [Microlunatus soli]SDT20579.1 Glycosyltransferase involved in cell wall bisynthesis [Microlunatus soli]